MKVSNHDLKKLLTRYREISILNRVKATLDWDLNVNMPPKGSAARAEESAYLAELVVNKWLDPQFRTLLEKLTEVKNLPEEERAMVRNLNYGGKYYYKVPKDIIVEKEHVTSTAFLEWSQARETNDFKRFQPHLEKIVDLNREIAGHLGYKSNPYDALLDMFEPELTAADVEKQFSALQKELVVLVKKITKSKKYTDAVPFINGKTHYPIPDQEKILRYAMHEMNFDFQAGRVDVSAHPFTMGLSPTDVRLTTFYNTFDFRESFTSTMHETGHGLYEQGVNPTYTETPLAGGVSLGIHEALSRFWENMIGKNPVYLRHMAPVFQTQYEKQLGNSTVDDIVRSLNLVKPSLIRIHADEVTYSLHIILRFQMENELMNGKISVKDAPEVWRDKSKSFFGIAPETDSEGILQDVHWTYGVIGYFPAYALGNLYGAQFFDTMKKTVMFDDEVGRGNLLPVKEWLDTNIHTHGSMYFPKDLVKRVTGKPLDYMYFVKYLTEKYSLLYDLK